MTELRLRPMSSADLRARPIGERWFFDVECYPNFFLVMFLCDATGETVSLRATARQPLNVKALAWMLYRFELVGFNSRNYDLPMIAGALDGADVETLHLMSLSIIRDNLRTFAFEERWRVTLPANLNHIDLVEVVPLTGSLKMRGAQMHAALILDLPFDPSEPLTRDQAHEVELYCGNDLATTKGLANELKGSLDLRVAMGQKYGLDLRSKSNAQIAEAVVAQKLTELTHRPPKRPKVAKAPKPVRYAVPDNLRGAFISPKLNALVERIGQTDFSLNMKGEVVCPQWLKNEPIRIANGIYRMGAGGLHSSEKSVSYLSTPEIHLIDRDVASYYPAIIMAQRLFPAHLGEAFLDVFAAILEERLEAKRVKNKVVAESLKIVVNGSFGKFGSMYSLLYAPQLMVQVTLSGQLFLLLFIERLESLGIEVISANTDGVVMRVPTERLDAYREAVEWWEATTTFTTEETRYRGYFARDVNSYVAVKTDGKIKAKNALSNPWAGEEWADYSPHSLFRFHKNPTAIVCVEAVWNFLRDRTPIEDTVSRAQDARSFAIVRKVDGGGSKDGKPLGRVVRWYWSKASPGPILNAKGGAVATSTNGRPMLDMPERVPDDVDREEYVRRARAALWAVGFYRRRSLFELMGA